MCREQMEQSRSESCGVWGCRPRWLQRFATPRGFLVVYGLLGTIQALSYIYFVATLTTMERRFKIPSRTTGLMLSGNEISQVLLALILTYFGGRGNRPVWIAWGVSISAVSCFILVLPHLIYGPGSEALALTREYIDAAALEFSAEDEQVLRIANATFLELVSSGTAFTFDIFTNDDLFKFAGLTMALRTMGPALGFALAFGCLNIYVAPTLTPIINAKDPRWVGAWWLGWLILGSAMLLFAGLISLFPRHLPPPSKRETKRLDTSKDEISKPAATDALLPRPPELPKPTIKEFPVALRRLLKNKLLIFNIVSSVFYILGASGYITFSTKYMEVQFHQAAAGSAMLSGAAGLMAMVAGFLVSGFVISKFRPRPRILLFWNVIAGAWSIATEIIFIFVGCDNQIVHGATPGGGLQLNAECNIECNCPANLRYSPVCIGNTTFFSACHAGCTTQLSSNEHNIICAKIWT
ncbi:hypothetical protein B566_EDAN006057 [Ephemera danica]|nr:hypothetical protein B566_EDAN006057 [Ephemera danica]